MHCTWMWLKCTLLSLSPSAVFVLVMAVVIIVLHHLESRIFSYSAMNTFIQTSHASVTSTVYRTNINESSTPQKE